MALLSPLATEIVIPVCAVIGITFPWLLWWLGSRNSDNRHDKKEDPDWSIDVEERHEKITRVVFQGVKYFRSTEFRYVGGFVVAFVGLIFLILGSLESFSTQSRPCKSDPSNKCKPALTTAIFTAVSFLLGAFISVLSGFLGTEIAIRANARTALVRSLYGRNSIAALWSGAVMGFLPAGIGLLGLYLEIILFKLYYGNDWEGLFEAITGYGLGGSSMALFLRASGGIYAEAANFCRHLVMNNESQFNRTEPNPAVHIDWVGDIVGRIAGVGPDFVGSYAESSCAALVVASVSSFGIKHDFTAMCYPLLISSMGIFVCVVTILIREIKFASKRAQLIISTILMTVGIVALSLIALPPSFTVYKGESQEVVKSWKLSLCVAVGLWAGLIIESVDAFDAISSFLLNPVDTEVGVGSVSIAAFSAFVSSHFAATYGIAVAALGMLSTISTRLAKYAYGSINDNAKRIARVAVVGHLGYDHMTQRFAIKLPVLESMALLGAFVSRLAIWSPAGVLTPKVIIGLAMGARLPSYFSAMTMKRVGRAGFEMAREICRHHADGLLDYDAYFQIATDASFKGMIGPGALVMSAPLIVGTVFGVETLAGLLAGSLGAVVQIANIRGAWAQARVDIKTGALEYARTLKLEGSESSLLQLVEKGWPNVHVPSDTSVLPLSILVKLMAVESLVLAPWFTSHGALLSKII